MNHLPRLVVVMLLVLLSAPALAVPILPVDTTTAGFVGMSAAGPTDQAVVVTSYEEFASIFGASTAGLANPYLAPSIAGFFVNGGVRCAVVRVAAADDATVIGHAGLRTGMHALLNEDDVSFVAAPGMTSPAVQSALITMCETAGDRMAILDPDQPADYVAIQAQRAALVSSDGFAALYYPWITATPAGVPLLLPPSGFVAGAYSAISAQNSPVGIIATATGVAYEMNSAEQDVLNAVGINGIRNLVGSIRIWGARTLANNPEWVYVAVRRMGMAIEESILEGTAWCLPEINDEVLWAQLRSDAGSYLDDLFRAGWFAGATSSDSYFVLCGLGTTMTFQDVEEGRTILVVGYAPTRPAEFTVLTITHDRSATSSVEMASQTMSMSRPTPNPFNPTTEIELRMPHDGHVTLSIYDIRGARVRVLHEGLLSTGRHTLQWNGLDDRGRALPSGVYLASAVGDGAVANTKLVLSR